MGLVNGPSDGARRRRLLTPDPVTFRQPDVASGEQNGANPAGRHGCAAHYARILNGDGIVGGMT